eukprot:3788819-Amphidinium_carterae.1
MELLKSITGTEGADILKQRWKADCVPDAKCLTLSISVAVAKSTALLASPAYNWTTSAVQTELTTADAWLKRIQSEVPLHLGTSTTPFLQNVMSQLTKVEHGHRRRHVRRINEGDESTVKKVLTGSEAIEARWQFVSKQKENGKLEDYKVFATWKHLMSESTLQEVDELKTKLLSKCSVKSPKKLKKTSPKKQAKQQAEKRSAEADLDAAARAQLFG